VTCHFKMTTLTRLIALTFLSANSFAQTNNELKLRADSLGYNLDNITFEDIKFHTKGCSGGPYLFFDEHSYTISKRDSVLETLTIFLKENSKFTIKIDGHSDIYECLETDTLLSFNRAFATRQFLINNGVDSNRIIVRAMGGQQPVSYSKLLNGDKYPDGCKLNRRVSFSITDK
ncbi:MAG: OmpA family protein, partial [Bacteroidia bacterium]